jgi:hypothetical protein
MPPKEENKETSDWKPRFLSEYSMGELDFLRFNDHCKFIEKISGEINSTDVPTLNQCQNYFAGLNVLYKLWRPIIASDYKLEKLDKQIKEAKHIKRVWEMAEKVNNPLGDIIKLKMVDLLDDFHTTLMDMKQIIGLGIKVQRNLTTRERIKLGISGEKKKMDYMPEP